jgi:hypothetical protein
MQLSEARQNIVWRNYTYSGVRHFDNFPLIVARLLHPLDGVSTSLNVHPWKKQASEMGHCEDEYIRTVMIAVCEKVPELLISKKRLQQNPN